MDENLKKLKTDLDAQIRQMGDGLDDASREKLDKLMRFVEMKLQRPDDPGDHERLVEHLEDDIQYFEVSHPDLTTVMNNMLVMLSNLGI
ncbi:MAG: DUF4404 family protein [Deltaproteobacteria bacterium]|jgi:hypothetical protein